MGAVEAGDAESRAMVPSLLRDAAQRQWVDRRQLTSRYSLAYMQWLTMHLAEGKDPMQHTTPYDLYRIRRVADHQVTHATLQSPCQPAQLSCTALCLYLCVFSL